MSRLLQHLSKIYPSPRGDVLALRDVSFSVNRGEFVTITNNNREEMKIALFVGDMRLGGVTTFVLGLGKILLKAEHTVTLVACGQSECWPRLAENGIPAVSLPINRWESAVHHVRRADTLDLAAETRRPLNMRDAIDRLQHGGAVLIASGGRSTTNFIWIPFHGRQLPLPVGFAELTQLSQATVVATSAFMSVRGNINLVYTPLPPPTSSGTADNLFHAYVAFLESRWTQLLPRMNWGRLKDFTTMPKTVENNV